MVCEFSITVNEISYPCRIRSLTDGFYLSPNANAVLPIAVLAGMSVGQNIDMNQQAMSPVMLQAVDSVQEIYGTWFKHFSKVKFENYRLLNNDSAQSSPPQKTACFFSAGVDAFYTLLKNIHQINTIIFLQGFDFGLCREGVDPETEMRREVMDIMGRIADDLNIELIEIEIDFESMRALKIDWANTYGLKHVCVAHLLQDHFNVFLASSSQTFKCITPDGYHPLVDPAWASERVCILSKGYDASRIKKIKYLSQFPIVKKTLRVCSRTTRNGLYNCGKCEKCIRTKLEIKTVGILEEYETIDPTIDFIQLYKARISPKCLKYYHEIVEELELSGKYKPLKRKIKMVLLAERFKKSKIYQMLRQLKRTFRRATKMNGVKP